MRKKFSIFFGGFSRKKIVNLSNLRNILKNGSPLHEKSFSFTQWGWRRLYQKFNMVALPPTATAKKYQPCHIRRYFEINTWKYLWKSLFNKAPGLQPAALTKKRQVFFICEIIKNTLFCETPPDDCFWKSTEFYQKHSQ